MNVVHLQKAFAFIACGLVEKEKLLKESPNRYPYSKNLQRGINMFLAACLEMGHLDDNIFKRADESLFLEHYINKPICDWFEDWDQDALVQFEINLQPFYFYGPFAYRRGKKDVYIATEECVEFLSTQEINIIEGTDERALYEKIIQLSQDDYCKIRQYIIKNPIISLEDRRAFLLEYADNANAKESFNLAYELFEETYTNCPSCGWTMTEGIYGYSCVSEHCLEHMPAITEEMIIDASMEPVYRLKKGIMRYFAQPGKLEMEIAKFCEKKKLEYDLWPQKDRFDIEVRFSDGEIWEIDAKAYRNPISLCAKIKKDGGFPSGNYKLGYYVVPTEYTSNKNNYTSVVNNVLTQQPNIKCVTLASIKRKINLKMGEINV
ncbi:MAG: hypothetical protein PUK49_00715 [Oscillospiraceae bacterium]|nr:hypothetical protein [Oscillospiraceae bacterium]